MTYSPASSVFAVKDCPEQPPKNWLNFSQSLTSMPAAGLPLNMTLPCTLPVPGAGLAFSTPVSAAAEAGEADALAAVVLAAVELAAGELLLPPPPAQAPRETSAAARQALANSL